MLGQLYPPKGRALETAQAVLEVKNPYAVNVAKGCLNKCRYCYVPKFLRKEMPFQLPKESPVKLAAAQLEHGIKPEGVFLSFLTDPLLPEIREDTHRLWELLEWHNIPVAVLSKLPHLDNLYSDIVRHGTTIVSLETAFYNKFEGGIHPAQRREELWTLKREFDAYVWVSMEPYPCTNIYPQDLKALLDQLLFVDFIVFGMWNYDYRARTEQARQGYTRNVEVLTDFCKAHGIRLHVKSDTLKFIGMTEKNERRRI